MALALLPAVSRSLKKKKKKKKKITEADVRLGPPSINRERERERASGFPTGETHPLTF